MAAPVIQAASNCSWIAALVIGLVCTAIVYGMEKLETGVGRTKLLAGIQWLWMLLIVSEFLHWIMLCWPNHDNYHAVPLIVLVLAAFSLSKGRRRAANVAGVLFWGLIFLLGAVLISGIKEVKLENLKLQWKMQTAY